METPWYSTISTITKELVQIRSVSLTEGESRLAQRLHELLLADNYTSYYTEHGLDSLPNDLYGRSNVYALVRGQSPQTVILLGHFDTVETADYGELEPFALKHDLLAQHEQKFLTEKQRAEAPGDWMYGRGAADMKSGVALNLALIRHLAQQNQDTPLPYSVLFLATADEENESAGAMQAQPFLRELRARHDLRYTGVINTDYTTIHYADDPHRSIYSGSIGKLLPAFLCVGQEGHVGRPFAGLDVNLLVAELVRDLSLNPELCDIIPGQISAPPVTLHARDLKTHYDVQLPFLAYFYLNVMTLTTGPDELLERLSGRAEAVLAKVLRRVDKLEQTWQQAGGKKPWQEVAEPRRGRVWNYADLYQLTTQRLGESYVQDILAEEEQRLPLDMDKRERSLQLVQRLWRLSEQQGPAVVIFYAPPYYPTILPTPGPLQDAIDRVVEAHPELKLKQRTYYPGLSDLSYFQTPRKQEIEALRENFPLWSEQGNSASTYAIPLQALEDEPITLINWGPFGHGAHQRDERVLQSYAFEVLPRLLEEVLTNLGRVFAS